MKLLSFLESRRSARRGSVSDNIPAHRLSYARDLHNGNQDRQQRTQSSRSAAQKRSGTAEACILLLCPCAIVRRDAGVAGDGRPGCASCMSSYWGRSCRVSHRPHFHSLAARHIATRGGQHVVQETRRARSGWRRCETRQLLRTHQTRHSFS